MFQPVREEIIEHRGYYIHHVMFDTSSYFELGEQLSDFQDFYGLRRFRSIGQTRSFIDNLIRQQHKQAEADHLKANALVANDVEADAGDAFTAYDDIDN